jgi:hypothetical protein
VPEELLEATEDPLLPLRTTDPRSRRSTKRLALSSSPFLFPFAFVHLSHLRHATLTSPS